MNNTIGLTAGIVLLAGAVFGVNFYKNSVPVVLNTNASSTSLVNVDTYGMSQYNDTLGFSFWYPGTLKIKSTNSQDSTNFPGGVVVENLQIGSAGGTSIFVVDSSTSSITDEPNNHASPIAQTKYFYNFVSKQWMVTYPEGNDNGGSTATTVADISNTTMSGLVMFPSGRRFDTTIIPISMTRFIVVSDGGGSSFTTQLSQTVSLVGVSIENSKLSQVLKLEALAFAGEQAIQDTVMPALSYLNPNTGPTTTQVTITGSGFSKTGNKIKFGSLGSENNPVYNLNSTDGKTITFSVPSSNYLSCWTSRPFCAAAAFLTQPGEYEVSVINDYGMSNKIIFTVVSSSSNMTAPIVVYKTKHNYSNLVSVVLSADKTKIVAYPGPSDAKHESPISLNSDYFIGVMPGSGNIDGAFLNLDIAKYSVMPEFSLNIDQLYNLIIDKNPFIEIYNCSKSTTQSKMVGDINKWIGANQLSSMCVRVS